MIQKFTHRQKEFKKSFMVIDHDAHKLQMVDTLPIGEKSPNFIMVTHENYFKILDDCVESGYVVVNDII